MHARASVLLFVVMLYGYECMAQSVSVIRLKEASRRLPSIKLDYEPIQPLSDAGTIVEEPGPFQPDFRLSDDKRTAKAFVEWRDPIAKEILRKDKAVEFYDGPHPVRVLPSDSTVFLIAKHLDLSGALFRYRLGNTGRNLVILADTIHLASDATIDLHGPWSVSQLQFGGREPDLSARDGDGGDCIMRCRKITVENDAKLIFFSPGARGGDEFRGGNDIVYAANSGARGGDLILAFDEASVSGLTGTVPEVASLFVRHEAPGGRKGKSYPENADSRKHYRVGNNGIKDATDDPVDGRDGYFRIEVGSVANIDFLESIPSRIRNYWQMRMYEAILVETLDAMQRNNRREAINALRQRFLVPGWPIGSDFRQQAVALLSHLLEVNEKLVPHVWHRRESVIAPSGLTRQADLFVEGASLKNYVVPTEVLLHCYQSGSKQTVGFLTANAAENEITLLFDTEMVIPDWLEVALRKKLAASNEELSGVFHGWTIVPVETAFPNGVKRVKVSVLNETWRWEVTLDGNLAPLLMTQFASTSGIPFSFDWKYSGSDSIEGRTFTVRPSLARRREATLKLENGLATNAGTRKVSLEYVRIGKDEFHVLSPPPSFDPGATKAIPLPAGTDPNAVTIPVAGLVHAASAELTNAGDFLIAEAGGAFETLTIENLIPARLQDRQQSVRYIEIQVEQLAGSAEPFEVTQGGTHKLGPESVPGSVKSIKFLRPQGIPRRYRLSGRIEYLGGGHQTLATKVVDSLNIDVDESWLPVATQ